MTEKEKTVLKIDLKLIALDIEEKGAVKIFYSPFFFLGTKNLKKYKIN